MFIARWQIDAKFGQKQTVIELCRKWDQEVGRQAGTGEMGFQILTGSIGAREATVEINHQIESLAKLEAFYEKISKIDAHRQWGTDLEPHIVSGSAYWQIFRLVE